MEYYEIRLSVYHPEIWYFGDMEGIINNYDLTSPDFYMGSSNYQLSTHVRHGTAETDYAVAGYASVPCISERAKSLISSFEGIDAQLDFLPLEITNYQPNQSYYAMVVKLLKDCVDESRSEWSEVTFLKEETPTSRGFLRKYGSFFELTIDSNRTGNLDIFRLMGGQTNIIVSQRFKDLWQGSGLTGMSFSAGLNHLNL